MGWGWKFRYLVRKAYGRLQEAYQSIPQQWRFLHITRHTWSERRQIANGFAVRKRVLSKPLRDDMEVSTFFEAVVHGQLLFVWFKTKQSIKLVVLSLVALDLPDKIALPNAQLLASLKNAHIETFHLTTKVLELNSKIRHVLRLLAVFSQLSL